MFMRRRPLVRAAAIGGGAYVAGRHVAWQSVARDQAENEQNARLADLEQQAVIAQPVPVPPDPLDQLATLHKQGTLSDDEFTTAKARLLAS